MDALEGLTGGAYCISTEMLVFLLVGILTLLIGIADVVDAYLLPPNIWVAQFKGDYFILGTSGAVIGLVVVFKSLMLRSRPASQGQHHMKHF